MAMTGFSQGLFDAIMERLDEKQNLLMEYYELTIGVKQETLVDQINDIVDRRQEIINMIDDIDKEIFSMPKKLFGNEAQALSAVLKLKVPDGVTLPPILATIDKKCKIIYNILVNIKEADEGLREKARIAKQDIILQIEQVKNNKQVFDYRQKYQNAGVGSMLDEKR